MDEQALLTQIDDVSRAGPPELSALGAGILLLVDLGIARDSRSIAAKLGIEHALILREAQLLSAELGLISVVSKGDRSQRLFLQLAPTGHAVLDTARSTAS